MDFSRLIDWVFSSVNEVVFKIKHEPKCTLIKYKACLVARKFEQQEGIYYQEVFASVIDDYPHWHCCGYST
jgi:hypothetical protein